jgi:hypothetical protein
MMNLIKDLYWDINFSSTEKTVCFIAMIAVGTVVGWIVG